MPVGAIFSVVFTAQTLLGERHKGNAESRNIGKAALRKASKLATGLPACQNRHEGKRMHWIMSVDLYLEGGLGMTFPLQLTAQIAGRMFSCTKGCRSRLTTSDPTVM